MAATLRQLLAFLLIAPYCFAADPGFDLVIANGHIVDRSGSPW